MIACIEPGPDEIVIPKTSSSVFCSTNVDYILRRCMLAPVLATIGNVLMTCMLLAAAKVACNMRTGHEVGGAAVGSLGVRFLILAGCVTDQCVESAVRDACDKHYYVTLVTGEHCTLLCAPVYLHLQSQNATICCAMLWLPAVVCAADACATYTQERHDNSLRTIKGFCRQRTVQQLGDELASVRA